MTDITVLVLQEAWRQCERHMHHLQHALSSISHNMPLTAQSVASLDDEAVQDWDQFILRFTKLQDAMRALVPGFVGVLARAF